MPEPLYVCRKCKHHDCLVEVVEAHSHVTIQMVRCQKICHGPVVGTEVDGRMEWFERVSSVQELAALVKMTRGKGAEKIPKALKKRRVKRWSGRPPRR
jgi:hypothetical protein